MDSRASSCSDKISERTENMPAMTEISRPRPWTEKLTLPCQEF